MPYIPHDRRLELAPPFTAAQTAGELNYVLSEVMKAYVRHKGLSYQTINDISGAMTEALAEFRRRVTVPYEDTKIAANGDIYP